MSLTTTDPRPPRTMMKWQRRKSHSLRENINPSSESNCSQCLLAELTKLEEQVPEARMGTGGHRLHWPG